MIWADFITYVAGFLLASTMLILNRHEKIKVVILFFIAGGLLYAAMNAAYSVEEKFNPATDDCTEWEDCPILEGEHGREFNITPDEMGCIYLNQGMVLRQVQAENLNKLFRLGEAKDCVSWQPKKQERLAQKPIPESTNSMTIKLINSSERGTSQGNFHVQIVPCECCKTNTCLNLSNPKDLEELNVRQCGYAYRDYINQSVSESQRENAKWWLINECEGVTTNLSTEINVADFCKDNPSDSERCECVKSERRGSNESTYDCWTINLNYPEGDNRRYDEGSYTKTYNYNGTTIITNNVDGRQGVKEICEFQNTFAPTRVVCVEAVPR